MYSKTWLFHVKRPQKLIWCNESSNEQHLFDIEIFSKIINAFTFTFDQFNASLLNKSIKYCTLAF